MKAKAAQRWVKAVNQVGGFGRWDYEVIEDPQNLGLTIDRVAHAVWDTTHIKLADQL